MADSVYVIERDERDKGGKLTVVAEFNSYPRAMAAWSEVQVPEDEDVQMWLLRKNGEPLVLDCKCK